MKKEYTAPELVVLGDVQEITQGQRNQGGQDQHMGWAFGAPEDPCS